MQLLSHSGNWTPTLSDGEAPLSPINHPALASKGDQRVPAMMLGNFLCNCKKLEFGKRKYEIGLCIGSKYETNFIKLCVNTFSLFKIL
jgi:hypothetical protein